MKYPELKWVVFAKWGEKPYWEPIAAFNVKSVAEWYMRDCERVNSPMIKYKVEENYND